jgi:hypothetical protein
VARRLHDRDEPRHRMLATGDRDHFSLLHSLEKSREVGLGFVDAHYTHD